MNRIEKKVPSKTVADKLKTMTTTSGKIRYLASQGWSQGDTARFLGKRPQHVSNVLRTPVTTPTDKI